MIRFFISSTFRDMQAERDTIHKSIYPIIRKYGLERGVNVDICDLRWGIDFNSEWSEEESIAEIMRVCFTEVKDCKPHIVAMIGNYYGSKAPNKEMIVDLWKSLGRSVSELPDDTDISLTQWELEFSFLSQSNSDTKSLCLFRRDAEGSREKEVDALEKRIKNKEASSKGLVVCQDYTGINEFEQAFIEYAKRRIDEEAIQEAESNWVKRELKYARACSYDRCLEFAGREEYIQAFLSFLEDEEKSVLAVYGQSGIGKSSLMARLFQLGQSICHSEIIMCGISQANSYYLNVLIEIIFIIEHELLGEDTRVRDNLFTEDAAEKHLVKTLKEFNEQNKKILIFVDAMDKLSIVSKNRLVRIFDNMTSTNIKLICSQIPEYDEDDNSNTCLMEVNPLTENDIKEILAKRLFDAYQVRSKTDSPVIDAIIKKEGSVSPLYIKAVINILKMHMSDGGSIQDKDAYFVSLIQKMPEVVSDICWFAFEEALSFVFDKEEKDYKEKFNAMEEAIGLIAVARFGLREKDLECIMNGRIWTNVSFASIRLFLRDFFRQYQDGCWTFEHDIIKEGIIAHFNKEPNGEKNLRRQLYAYLLDEDCDDLELKIKEGLYLSYYFDNGDMTIELLKSLAGYPILPIRAIAAKEIEKILNIDKDHIWYRGIIRTDTKAVMGALSSLLEIRRGEDYSRRMPARFAADLFWKIISLNSREAINKWSNKPGRTFFEKQLMASLCAEYVGIYEDSGDRIFTVGYSFYPKDFYLNKENLDKLTTDQKHRAYRQMSTLFNINNSVLSNFNNYSKDLMAWLDEDPLDMKDLEKGVTRSFVGNKGQYYSAIGNIEKSLSYRLFILGKNINNLFGLLGEKYLTEKNDFMLLCDANEDMPVNILDVDIAHHIDAWELLIKKTAHERYSEQEFKAVSRALDSIARGYFVICYDINKIPKETNNYEKLIEKGCLSIEASIKIFKSEVVENRRELFSAYIRRIQINLKKEVISKDELLQILGWGIQAIDEYIDHADNLGFAVGDLLMKSLSKLDSRIAVELNPDECAEYQRKVKRLNHELYG